MTKPKEFDFDAHKYRAEIDYGRSRHLSEAFAKEVERILKVVLVPDIKIHEFQARAKTICTSRFIERKKMS